MTVQRNLLPSDQVILKIKEAVFFEISAYTSSYQTTRCHIP